MGSIDKFVIIDMAFAMMNADEEHGMKIADHKLICKILDAHTESTRIDTIKDNDIFKDKLIGDVIEVIRAELRPIKESIERIEKKVNALEKGIIRIKKVQSEHGKRLTNLEESVNKLLTEHNKNHNANIVLPGPLPVYKKQQK